MKLPRFTLGFITGVTLSLVLAAFVFYFIRFPNAGGYYESPTIPFYVTGRDPNYAKYMQLESRDYWRNLSHSTEVKVKKYCQENNITADVRVFCIGSPQNYQIYYSTGRNTSIYELLTRHKLEDFIVEYVDSSYNSMRDTLIHGTQADATRPLIKPEGGNKPQPEGDGRTQ